MSKAATEGKFKPKPKTKLGRHKKHAKVKPKEYKGQGR